MTQPHQPSSVGPSDALNPASANVPPAQPTDPAGLGAAWRVTVNGEAREIVPGTTVRALIEAMGLAGVPCAAEVNQRLVPRREHETRAIAPGDVIELVSLVGGG